MINYSITARAVNPNLFEINQAKTRINQAKAEGKLPGPKDVALVETVKRQLWRFVIQAAISILTAIATALGVTSCMATM